MRTPRSMTFGSYNTHADGRWTLASWDLSPAVYKPNLVEVPGRSEPLDLSTALTDGEPTYSSRTLTAVFEGSEGTRLEREARISQMVNALDGYRMNIILPDDAAHYITGRLSVARLYNDEAHGSVQVTAVCDPWRYAQAETVVNLQAAEYAQEAVLVNQGRRGMVPLLEVTGGDVLLVYGAASWALSAGTYALPDIYLDYGEHSLTYTGTAALKFTYREAVL